MGEESTTLSFAQGGSVGGGAMGGAHTWYITREHLVEGMCT